MPYHLGLSTNCIYDPQLFLDHTVKAVCFFVCPLVMKEFIFFFSAFGGFLEQNNPKPL